MILETLLTMVLFAQDPPTDERIRRWCDDLASEDLEVRDEATAALVKIGRPAVSAVRALLDHRDGEVRLRARSILDRIEAALKAKALTLGVSCDRKKYRPGERIVIDAKIRNVEDFPVTALKFIHDGGLLADCRIVVLRDGKPIRYAGGFLPQVMVHRHMTEDRFFVIEPGKSASLRSVDFSAEWDLGGMDPSLKAAYEKAKQVPLKSGRYTVRASYRFQFDLRRLEGASSRDWSFAGNSKAMLARAWQGTLEGETEFEVVE
ncbi:MAG: hypothetical protein HYY17_00745 [Planctomycetes bacterium]|nr:hypothetical protein [Planctomycetota bacterium]